MDIDEILLDPANRLIIQAILKFQIQTLLKKLSETGVETLVLTASTEDKDLGYLGSEKGNNFLNHVSLEVVRKQFLHFCANTEPESNSSTSLEVDAPLPGKNFHWNSYNRCIQRHKTIQNASTHVEKISSQPCTDNCEENRTEQNRSSNAESQRRRSLSRVIDKSDQEVIDECSKHKTSQAMKSERQDRVSIPVGTEGEIEIGSNLYVGHRQKDSNVLTSSNINDSDLEMLCETVCRNISQETEHDKSVYKPDAIYDSSVNKKRELCHSDLNFPTSQRTNFVCTEKNNSSYTVSAAGNDSKLAYEIQILEEEARIKSEPHDLDPDPNLSDLMYPNAESATQSLNCDFTMNENSECIVSMNSVSAVSEGRMSNTSCTGVNSINTLNNCGDNGYNQHTTSSTLVSDILCASEFPLNSRGDPTTKFHHIINYRKMSNDLACSECGQMFNKTPSLIRHKVRKHSPQIFECLVCAKKYGYKSDLDKHFRTHSGEKPYACSVCGRGFADSGNKNKHESKCRLHIRRLSMSERDNYS
ncbi:hypothetical protein ACJMK2_025590 [Sinanodonta woodiana]|uniref:C2H2-type domain-containing protein n=1 Tax=Sinanodonta woodiana TaxID=1069815 RepID=A0ABD3XKQ9_SINWO